MKIEIELTDEELSHFVSVCDQLHRVVSQKHAKAARYLELLGEKEWRRAANKLTRDEALQYAAHLDRIWNDLDEDEQASIEVELAVLDERPNVQRRLLVAMLPVCERIVKAAENRSKAERLAFLLAEKGALEGAIASVSGWLERLSFKARLDAVLEEIAGIDRIVDTAENVKRRVTKKGGSL